MADGEIARLGVGRLGAFRLGYVQPWIKVYINSVLITGTAGVRVSGATITDELNHTPNLASFRCAGFTPVKGQDVKMYMADVDLAHQLFGGRILSVSQTYEADKPAAVVWDCSCIDYTWLLDRRPVIKKYTSQSATTIVLDLISTYTAGFTTAHVAAGLASIDEITFTNENVTDALTRLSERIGGYWYIDYASDLHFFLTETDVAGAITQTVPRSMKDIKQDVDLSQVATRVTARGGGSTAASDVLVGATTLPVEDSSWYSTGTVECGPQRITYTGVQAGGAGSTTGYIEPPAMSTSVTVNNGVGSLTSGATYLLGWAYVTAEGQTTVVNTTSIVATGATPSLVLNTHPVPTDPKITRKVLFLSSANGNASTLRAVDATLYTPGYTTQIELLAYVAGGAVPSATNAAGLSTIATAAGSTTLTVEDLAQFPASGWAEVGGQRFLYTGRSASSGAGTLTGIPASGVGSLAAAVRGGTVKTIPHLTGVSGIVYAINKGDQVNIIVTVNDATAQTAMAGFVGGDGIHEMFITDGRWALTEATANANAELTERKNPLVTVTFQSRDQTLASGKDITITLSSPAISGTFKVQRVTFSELGLSGPKGLLFPLRTVEASSRRYSFEDLLRQIKGKAA